MDCYFLKPWLLLFTLLIPASLLAASHSVAPRVLDFYTWSDHIDPTVVAEFEQKFHARINFTYFESDEQRDQEITHSAGQGYDVILLNGLKVGIYADLGWLAPIDQETVPNQKYVHPRWLDLFRHTDVFGIPYYISVIGIAYRKDLYPQPITRWSELLNPDKALHHRITMPSSGRELTSIALKANRQSANSTDQILFDEASVQLMKQKPYVHSYQHLSSRNNALLVEGITLAAPMYSGHAKALQNHHPDIAFVIPEEGGLISVNFLSVTHTSKQKALAFEFINFLNEPSVAARQALHLFYATPNEAAKEFLTEQFLSLEPISLDSDQQGHTEFFKPVPALSQRKINLVSGELLQ